MKHIRYDTGPDSPTLPTDNPNIRIGIHPSEIVSDFGITFSHGQRLNNGEVFMFYNCRNLPDPLPSYMSEATERTIEWAKRYMTETEWDAVNQYQQTP